MDKIISFFKKYQLKFNIFKITVLCFIICFLPVTCYALVDTPNGFPESSKYYEVLIITSQDEHLFWENNVLDRLSSLLTENQANMHYQCESLGQYNSDDSYLKKQAELWNMKYKNTHFDLIITLDDEALNFVGNYYSSDFLKSVPVVYGGVNEISKLSNYPFNTFTGVTEFTNVKSMIDEILLISPRTSKINILLDNSITSKHIEYQFKDWIPYYINSVSFNFIKGDSINDICSELNKGGDCGPIIVMGNYRDSYDKTYLNPQDIVTYLKEYTTSPVFTMNEAYMGSGVTGGLVVPAKSHGELIYEIANRILNGERPEDIPSVYDSSNVFMFDAQELHAYSVSRKLLPKGSIIINDSWMYKGTSMAIVITLILFLITAAILISFQFYQHKKNERKALAEKRRYNQILANDKIKTEFFANFSHEIRTLLNVMLSGLQLLDIYKNNGRLTFANKEDEIKLTYIKQNGFRLLKLINNLIDMTKIESGFYNIELEVRNIVEVVEDITMSVVEYAKNRGITIIFDTNEEEVYMPLDPEKLDRIVLNLLSNAIKYTPKNGYIYVTMNCKPKKVLISVKDTGIGIPKSKQKPIFERFTQVNDPHAQTKEGSGIGLSLVYSLVHLLDGSITLNSDENKGCEFVVTLPVKDFDKASQEVEANINQSITNHSQEIMIELSDLGSNSDK